MNRVPVRLLIGLLKGLVLGGLVGYGVAALGFAAPGALIAYGGAAVVGMLMALVAGKPIWANDARIEVGMKAIAGALIGPGFMWLARHFLTMDLPVDPQLFPGVALQGPVALGTFAITSLAMVAALLGGFYDADNQPSKADGEAPPAGGAKKRIAAQADAGKLDLEELEDEEADLAEQTKKS